MSSSLNRLSRANSAINGERLVSFGLLLLSALLASIYPPGWGLQLVGFVAYVPLLLVLEWHLLKPGLALTKRAIIGILCVIPISVPFAIVGLDWIAASMHVFGHLPLLLAGLGSGLIYGFEVMLLLFIGWVVPLLFIRRLNGWDFGIRLFWLLMVDLLYPRFLQWSFGSVILTQIPALEQGADLVGAWGLGILPLGANLLLAGAISRWCRRSTVQWPIITANFVGYSLMLTAFAGYGLWRERHLSEPTGIPLDVAVVQPNFSLRSLAMDPLLAVSNRDFSLSALLEDSAKALSALPTDTNHPRLLVWPESAWPQPFFQTPHFSTAVRVFAQRHNTSIILGSVDTQQQPDGQETLYGAALLINAQGEISGQYNKMTLLPFGEYIPGANIIPGLEAMVHKAFPMISLSAPGTEYSVFEITEGYQVAMTICFDATVPTIFRRMGENGAQFAVNLANLAWFGRSKASAQLEAMLRWRAIENRLPVLMSSLSGETQMFTPTGDNQGKRLGLFEADYWSGTVMLHKGSSIYQRYAVVVQVMTFILLVIFLALGHFSGQVFNTPAPNNNRGDSAS